MRDLQRSMSSLLLIGMTVTAVAAPAPKADVPKDQEAAVVLVRKLGGRVQYDYQLAAPGPPYTFTDAQPKDPAAFHPVVAVDLRGTPTTDDDLKALARLPRLEILTLTDTKVTGAGLSHLKAIHNLRLLELWGTTVDDEGIKHLAELSKLWSLGLGGTRVTDAGLAHLVGLTALESLTLNETQITDAGLAHLVALPRLQAVGLSRTKTTREGAEKLRETLRTRQGNR